MSYSKKAELLEKPYLHLTDARQILGVAYPKFKPMWEQMIKDLEKESGQRLGQWNWGIPTEMICNYFRIDVERYKELAKKEKIDA
ncbi:hypothetical protein [Floccifex sp.]|uniref:hypothetical protein n=1 Tax=Floccifex sp. TaxID=2815810 RepID=UPI003EFE580F